MDDELNEIVNDISLSDTAKGLIIALRAELREMDVDKRHSVFISLLYGYGGGYMVCGHLDTESCDCRNWGN